MESKESGFAVAPGSEIVSDSCCFVCGQRNAGGLRVRFYRAGEQSAVARCTPDRVFAGYDGLLHGGITAALLDEIMIKALLAQGRLVMTARMSVSYHRPVRIGKLLVLKGTVIASRGRIFRTEGLIEAGGGDRLVSATGTYVELEGAERRQLERSIGG